MNNTIVRTLLILLPLLAGVLVYGTVAQHRVLWSVLSMGGVLAVIGLGVLAAGGRQPVRRASMPAILRAYALTTIVVVVAIALYDAATAGAMRWGFYAGFLTPSVGILLVFAAARLVRKHE